MIKALILYFLSLKPTHGYEIQKFIQINHMDDYTKIQSGSIYYALSKLEQQGMIELIREENVGAKVRKIYQITAKGKEELDGCLKQEVDSKLYEIGSDKFIIYAVLNGMEKAAIIKQIQKHMAKLSAKKAETEKWQGLKINENTLKVEKLCFEMMLSSLDYQMKWHQALIEELDACLDYSKQVAELIQKVDFSTVNDMKEVCESMKETTVEKLKKEILNNPSEAAEKLEQLISLMKG